MTKQRKVVSVLSTSAISGLVASALMTSQAFAAVDAYTVKVGGDVFQYSKTELMESYLDSTEGAKAPLFEDFQAKLTEGKGVYAYHDDKSGYVTAQSVFDKYLENEKNFNLDEFTASKDAKVVEVPTVKKAVVKDGEVKFEDQDNSGETTGDVKVESVSAINLKQVKIEFASKITDSDKIDDIEDEDNYTIENDEKDELKDIVDKVEMDESGKFAILTFKDQWESEKDGKKKYNTTSKTDEAIQNQEKYFITFDENITGKEEVKDVTFKDLDMPKVESVEIAGIDTIKVVFSEPVRPDYYDTSRGVACLEDEAFKINNDNISVNRVELVNDNKEANIKLGSTLKDGEKVKVNVKGSICDYAGFGVISETKDLTVKKDSGKPEAVGYKKVKKGEVTLIFNKDIRFKSTDDKLLPKDAFDDKGDVKEDDSDVRNHSLEEYYHTNEKTTAYAAKIDGKELTIYFDEDDNALPNGPANIYVKSGELETLWEVENDKVVKRVEREEDKTAPEVKKVEQDKDVANKIKVKFNEELDREEAENRDNYTIKDSKGDKWTINDVQYKNSDKEVTIITTKDLEADEYELTIDGVEDKAGNVMKKFSKKFTASEKDARVEDDLTVNLYNPGENTQKIVVDFDTKMKTGDDKYSIEDESKYTLIAANGHVNSDGKAIVEEPVNAFDNNKSSIQLDSLYNTKIKAADNDNKVEITLPYKKNKDDSYNFTKNKDGKYVINGKEFNMLVIQVGKVADVDDNINTTPLLVEVGGEGTVGIKKSNGDKLVRAISPDKVQVTFKEKIDFKNDDVVIHAVPKVAVNDIDTIKAIEDSGKIPDNATKVDVSKWDKDVKDGKTIITMTLDKNQKGGQKDKYDDSKYDHVLNYDGTFGDDHKVLFIEVKAGNSKNDYDGKLEPGVHRVIDNIAPVLVDNGKRHKKYRYEGNNVFGTGVKEFKNNDEAVEYYRNGNDGGIVLTFEEEIDPASVGKNSFTLDTDGDYKRVRVTDIAVDSEDKTKVVIKVTGLNEIEGSSKFGDGFDVYQNAPIRDNAGAQYLRGLGNQVEGIKTQIGAFDPLKSTKCELTKTTIGALEGTVIKDVPADTTAKALKAALTVSEKATAKVVDKDGKDVAEDTIVTADMKILVTAEDGKANTTYTLTIKALPSAACDITKTTIGTLEGTTIKEVPAATTAKELKDVLTVSEKATAKIVDKDGKDVADDTKLAADMKIVVTAENAKTTKEYTLTIKVEAPALSTACELTKTTIGTLEGTTIKEVPAATTAKELKDVLTVSEKATAKIVDKDGKDVADGTTVTADMKIVVTAEDGKTTKTYTITVK